MGGSYLNRRITLLSFNFTFNIFKTTKFPGIIILLKIWPLWWGGILIFSFLFFCWWLGGPYLNGRITLFSFNFTFNIFKATKFPGILILLKNMAIVVGWDINLSFSFLFFSFVGGWVGHTLIDGSRFSALTLLSTSSK